MNDLNKVQDNKLSDKEQINGAWVDVKLCTVKAVVRLKNLAALKKKKSISKNSVFSMLYYNELHYGNYE